MEKGFLSENAIDWTRSRLYSLGYRCCGFAPRKITISSVNIQMDIF